MQKSVRYDMFGFENTLYLQIPFKVKNTHFTSNIGVKIHTLRAILAYSQCGLD